MAIYGYLYSIGKAVCMSVWLSVFLCGYLYLYGYLNYLNGHPYGYLISV